MRKYLVIQNWKKSRTYISNLLSDIPESHWNTIPENNYSNLLWQFGHILASEYRLILLRTRGKVESDGSFMPTDFIELFAKGSLASSSNKYNLQNLFQIEKQQTEVIDNESLSWTENFLDQKAEGDLHPMFSKKIEAIEYAIFHNYLHCGQIGIIRRQLGFHSRG